MSPMVVDYFYGVDPTLHKVMVSHVDALAPIAKVARDNYLAELCESIVSQQLSVKAARTIWSRTHSVVSDWNNPDHILKSSDDALRACGLSYQKISYVKNIALHTQSGQLHILDFDTLGDEEVINELVHVKGIGRWTAEMFLIFTLGREDVFSGGDLGLRNAIDRLYGTQKISPVEAVLLAEKWKPYRSYASRALWRSLDNVPLS